MSERHMSDRTKTVLHILRNPYGHTPEEIRQAQLDAATEIENWMDAYWNMRKFAEANGLDTMARHPA
jgi:hypothetical protein